MKSVKILMLIVIVAIVTIVCFENIENLKEIALYKNLKDTAITFVYDVRKSTEEANKKSVEDKQLDKQAKEYISDEFSRYKITINNDVYTIEPDIFTGSTALPVDNYYGRLFKREGFAYVKVKAFRNGEAVKVDNLMMVQFPCEYKDGKFVSKDLRVEDRDQYLRRIYDAIIGYDYEITLLENGIDKPIDKYIEINTDLEYTSQGSKGSVIPYIPNSDIKERYKYSYHVNVKKCELNVKKTKIK